MLKFHDAVLDEALCLFPWWKSSSCQLQRLASNS